MVWVLNNLHILSNFVYDKGARKMVWEQSGMCRGMCPLFAFATESNEQWQTPAEGLW